jgi:DNA-binding NarL/FixJ family response regulator
MPAETTVLILDHNSEQLREIARQIAFGLNVNILSASSHFGALELVRQHKPNIALIAEGCETVEGMSIAKVLQEISPQTIVLIVPKPTTSSSASASS